MALIGEGEGHGGFSLLHALGAGYGSAIGIDLSVKVRLRDNEPNKVADDPSGVWMLLLILGLQLALRNQQRNYSGRFAVQFQ